MDLKNLADSHSGAFIQQCSSCGNEILAKPQNVLTNNQKQYWYSKQGLPQYLTISLQRVKIRYDKISYIGFDCWHNYGSNPKVIDIFVRESADDDEQFQHWVTLKAQKKSGKQIFQVNPQLSSNFKIIKFQIQQTFEQFHTYLNQIFIYGQIQQQKQDEMTSRHFNNVANELQMKETDRYEPQQEYYGSYNKHMKRSYQPSQQFERNMDILGVNTNVMQLEQAMQQLTRRVDQLDFKIGISHESIEEKVMQKVRKLLDQRSLQKQPQRKSKNETNSQQRNTRIRMLAQKLNQKMKERQRKIVQIQRRRSEKKRNQQQCD